MSSARRPAKLALRVACVLVGALLVPELVLRFLLFSPNELVARWAAPLRRSTLYAVPGSRADWALQARFAPLPEGARALLHPELGYLSAEIDPITYRHADEGELHERRPVLLYGDSFAQCVTLPRACWQGLLEESDLADRFALLNYGVGGYGLDQVCLLIERTLALYAAREPVVIVGVLVDDDLDRCLLGVREKPKPRFELEEGELVLRPPPPTTAAGIVEEAPGIPSYLLSCLATAAGLRATAKEAAAARESEARALAEHIVARIHAFLEGRGVTHFFCLFHARPSAETAGPFTWRERCLVAAFERLGIPFVSSKRALWEDARASGRSLAEYFVPATAKRGKNHYTALGNRAVFAALRAGIEGRFEPHEYLAGATPPGEAAPR